MDGTAVVARQSTVAAILAGGRGRRFGGIDKASLTLAGRPLLSHVIERIGPQVREIVINPHGSGGHLRAFGCTIVADVPGPGPANGPLTGLMSVMSALESRGDRESFVLSVPVDTPFLPADLRMRLATGLAGTAAPVSFAAGNGRTHPIIALWSPGARDPLRALFVERPEISLHGVMASLDATRVDFGAGTPVDAFFNINRPEDLREAERLQEVLSKA